MLTSLLFLLGWATFSGELQAEGSSCSVGIGDSCSLGSYFSFADGTWENPTSNNQIGTVSVGDSLFVSFDLMLLSDSASVWNNILHIGNINYERSPAIFLKPGANKLHIRMSDTDSSNTGYDPDDVLLTVNTGYNVKLTVIDGVVTSYIDDVQKIQRSGITIEQRVDSPIYFSNPWYIASDVAIRNLIIQPCGCSVSSTAFSYSSALVPVRDTQIGTIDIGASFRVSFDMEIHSGPTGSWRSVLHIGSEDAERLPAIFLKPSSNQLEFVMSDEGNNNRLYNFADILQLNTIYTLELIVSDGTVTNYLNGVQKRTRSNMNTLERTNTPIYVSDPWYSAADVTITNLIVEPLPTTQAPTRIPSSDPSTAPTGSPTIGPLTPAPTNIPTPIPTGAPSSPPTAAPSDAPSQRPTKSPTAIPSSLPTEAPTGAPIITTMPSIAPTLLPTGPTKTPTGIPSSLPSKAPTAAPTFTQLTGNYPCKNYLECAFGTFLSPAQDYPHYDGGYALYGSTLYVPDNQDITLLGHRAAATATFVCEYQGSCFLSVQDGSATEDLTLTCLDANDEIDASTCSWYVRNYINPYTESGTGHSADGEIMPLGLPSGYNIPNIVNVDLSSNPNDISATTYRQITNQNFEQIDNVYCLARESCKGSSFEYISQNVFLLSYWAAQDCTIDHVNGDVYISGHVVGERVSISNVDGDVIAVGNGALSWASVTNVTGALLVYGYAGAMYSQISGVSTIYVKGNEALQFATITSGADEGNTFYMDLDMIEHLRSYNVVCSAGETCVINCAAAESCIRGVFDCRDANCVINCGSNGNPCPTAQNVQGNVLYVDWSTACDN